MLTMLITRHIRAATARFRPSADESDRGDVVGWAITLPVVLLLFSATMEVGLWFQARNMCQAAAQAGVQAGKTITAVPGTGSSAASTYLTATAGSSVTHAQTSEQLTPTTITVTCRAAALTLIPLGALTSVTQSATAQRERFTTPGAP